MEKEGMRENGVKVSFRGWDGILVLMGSLMKDNGKMG